MQTIGEKLSEARKAKGISMREAAEATKIRGEYLSAFEGDTFAVNLPDVYIRGFLKNYARFLSLDPDKIIHEYDSLMSRAPSGVHPETQEILGRMDISDERASSSREVRREAEKEEDRNENESPGADRKRDSAFSLDQPLTRNFFLKVSGAVAGSLAVVFLLIFGVISIIRTEPPHEPIVEEPPPGTVEFNLVATGDVDNVRITEVETEEILWEGPLPEDERISVWRAGALELRFSHAENLRIEEGDRSFHLQGTGQGRATWDVPTD